MFCLPRRSSAGGGHVNRASSFSLILLSVLAPALSIGVPITPGHKSHKRTSDFPTSKATLHPGPCYGTQATARALVGRGRKHRHVHATFFFSCSLQQDLNGNIDSECRCGSEGTRGIFFHLVLFTFSTFS